MGQHSSKIIESVRKPRSTRIFRTDCLRSMHEGSNKTRFKYCTASKNPSVYFHAIQGRIGGHTIVPELMNHVESPHNWKEFVFYKGCSFNISSILATGLIEGGKEHKEGRHKINDYDFGKQEINDYDFGKQDQTRSSYTIFCLQMTSTRKCLKKKRKNVIRTTLNTSTCTKGNSQKQMAIAAAVLVTAAATTMI